VSLYPGSEPMVSHGGILLPRDAVNFWFDFSLVPTTVAGVGFEYSPVYASEGASQTSSVNCLAGLGSTRTAVSGTSLVAPEGASIDSGLLPSINGSIVLVYEHSVVNGTLGNSQTPVELCGIAIREIKNSGTPWLVNGDWCTSLQPNNLAVPTRFCAVLTPLTNEWWYLTGGGVASGSCAFDIPSLGPFRISAGMGELTTGTKVRPMEVINTTRPLTDIESNSVLKRLSSKWAVPDMVPI
jgi:hypothetical protein